MNHQVVQEQERRMRKKNSYSQWACQESILLLYLSALAYRQDHDRNNPQQSNGLLARGETLRNLPGVERKPHSKRKLSAGEES
jgi:hypothetical protein